MIAVMATTALLALAAGPWPPVTNPSDEITTRVVVDSSRREVIITVGPFDIPALPPGMTHDEMEMDGGEHGNTPVYRFEWPNQAWFRGFRYEMKDKNGVEVPSRVLHHMIMINFDRRQLLYPAVERLMGAGQETGETTIPRTIGVPLEPGQRLGAYFMWSNETGKDLEGVEFTIIMQYSPANLNPQPVHALPIYMDVNLTVGEGNAFDMPAGHSEKSYEFAFPINGRLLGVGGHMHDYGTAVRLEDVESGKVLTEIKAKKDKDGRLLKLDRKLFGVSGKGLKLEAGKRYRVVGVYDNPTGKMIPGAMAHMVGLFAPDNLNEWPAIDLADETLQTDLAKLEEMGGGHEHKGAEDHSGHAMPTPAPKKPPAQPTPE